MFACSEELILNSILGIQPTFSHAITLPRTEDGIEQLAVKIGKESGGGLIFEVFSSPEGIIDTGGEARFYGALLGQWQLVRLDEIREGYAYFLCHNHRRCIGTHIRILRHYLRLHDYVPSLVTAGYS